MKGDALLDADTHTFTLRYFNVVYIWVTNEVMPSNYGASIKLNLPSLQSLEKIGSASLIGIKRTGKRLKSGCLTFLLGWAVVTLG